MPSWKKHLLFSIFLLFIWIKLLLGLIDDFFLLSLLLFLFFFFSIFPDVDSTKSYIRKILSFLLASLSTIYLLLNFNLHSFVRLSLFFFSTYFFLRFFPTKHRGVTHTVWFSIICSFLSTLILRVLFEFSSFQFVVFSFFILSGYVSHLFLDVVT